MFFCVPLQIESSARQSNVFQTSNTYFIGLQPVETWSIVIFLKNYVHKKDLHPLLLLLKYTFYLHIVAV